MYVYELCNTNYRIMHRHIFNIKHCERTDVFGEQLKIPELEISIHLVHLPFNLLYIHQVELLAHNTFGVPDTVGVKSTVLYMCI